MSFRLFLFPATLLLLIAYTSLCVYRLLPGQQAATSLFVTLAVVGVIVASQIVPRLKKGMGGLPPVQWLAWGGAVLMGGWATFVLLAMAADCLYILALLAGLAFGFDAFPSPQFMRTVFLILLCASGLLTLLGLAQALRGPRLKRVTVRLPGLDGALAGLRIVQLSDLHIGATIHKDYIARVVGMAMALAPDLIAVTGDLADGSPDELRAHSEPLAGLRAPLGSYFVTGNHEYYSGALAWLAEVRRLGLIPLLNENRIVTRGGAKLLVAGVTDLSAHHFIPDHRSDPAKAALSAEPVALRLLLAHQPESCFAAEAAGFDLQLSGHTHAGQFFPFNLLVRLVKRYAGGLHRHGRLWLYVNAGTGYWGAPSRFAVPSEITLVTLAAA